MAFKEVSINREKRMRRAIIKIIGTILMLLAAGMIPAVFCAIRYHEPAMLRGLILSFIITGFSGLIMFLFTKFTAGTIFRPREGYITVAACWITASLFGTLPYLLSGYTTSFIDSLFDSAAGFTTTGCSPFDIDTLPKSLLLMKSIYNWMGGMGILIFIISVFPALGINGQVIARLETPAPTLEKTTIRMTDSARGLYIMYFSFTLAEFILLNLTPKMTTFEALINSLTNISTAGFFCHSEGLSYYGSLYVEIVFAVFSLLGAVNFILYSYIINGKWKLALSDIELRRFLEIVFAAGLICSLSLWIKGDHAPDDAFRYGFGQVISCISTSGFTVSNYPVWPSTCQLILLVVMFTGGCSSSTSGGIKIIRILIMMKTIKHGILRRLHSRAITQVKLNGRAVPPGVQNAIEIFIVTYLGFFLLSCFVLAFQGLDLHYTISAAAGMLSNSGTFLDDSGRIFCDYASFSPFIKLWLCLMMVVGRLELFTVIVLFTRGFWSKGFR